MKKIFTVFILCFCLFSNAQDSRLGKSDFRNAVAFDVAGILGRMSSAEPETMPFQFMYMHFTSKGNALRVGIGFNFSNNENQEGDDMITNSNGMLNFKLGYENRIMLSEKWIFAVGGDAVLKTESSVFSSENIDGRYEDKTIGTSVGADLILGIHYIPTSRLTIGTEASAEILRTNQEHNISSTFPDSAESNSQNIQTHFTPMLPMMLMVGIMF